MNQELRQLKEASKYDEIIEQKIILKNMNTKVFGLIKTVNPKE